MEIERKQRVEIGARSGQHRRGQPGPRIGHQHVEPAPGGNRARHQHLTRASDAQIARYQQRQLRQAACQRQQAWRITAAERQVNTVRSKRARAGCPDPARCTGDDRRAASEIMYRGHNPPYRVTPATL